MTEKTIEEMAHDYAVAQLSSGIGATTNDIEEFIKLACEVKKQAKKAQKNIAEDERRCRW
ncbi:hypothetical protein B9T31_09555 [Acinetobacter sp. ANC 4558]|uniref:hypothetical protein n=1 Tax=Acinetobacter sp. ANC 4558 TaxID=1977876 RepID=UPI000A33E28F|nr:hypothetical protein [Acinetobacter sp. ANC 4558]OTG85831.1 hypothetical protein B9T31_09555 [Acinetobacter sp. ANC 4558]